MSIATKTNTRSAARREAGHPDMIRVHRRAREQPQGRERRDPEAPADGVHRRGSGKSSLVFDTIAAQSQRLINEPYSAFVQGFMPTLARPEVDVLEGLTTTISVDQRRMRADPRSTVGTATDAGAMLRILFRRRAAARRPAQRGLPQRSPGPGSGAVTVQRGASKTVRKTFTRAGGMCPRCEGRGTVSDIDLNQSALREHVVPAIKALPGFISGTWLPGGPEGKGLSLTLWERKHDARGMAERFSPGSSPAASASVVRCEVREVAATA
jgi:hypothetical protein